MPRVSELFFKTAIVFLILGIVAGLQMAISGDHGAFPAHAHINLLGWVTSAIFGGYYALNPAKAERRVAMIHYGLYTVGLVIMLPSRSWRSARWSLPPPCWSSPSWSSRRRQRCVRPLRPPRTEQFREKRVTVFRPELRKNE